MKKIFNLCLLLAILFAGLIQAQQLDVSSQESVTPSATYPFTKFIVSPTTKVVCFTMPLTLAKATTTYSNPFTLPSVYWGGDSTKLIGVSWQATDTCQLTIALQIKNAEITGPASSVTAGTWATFATATTVQLNAGNDTLYSKFILPRGTVASGVGDEVAASGFGDALRLKVTFANPTTIGNSGYLRVWVYLKK